MLRKRSLANPPDYYNKDLAPKQQRTWRKTTRKMERNEELRALYPPFRSSSHINIIHIHHQSTIPELDELISKAKRTKRFVIDTESQKGEHVNQGALVQIQFVHSINNSTIILIEAHYLPDPTSTLFNKIKELCAIIFNNGNEIISWGAFVDEFKNFHYLDLFYSGNIRPINLQFHFSNPTADTKTHPVKESRDNENRDVLIHSTPGDNVYYNILDDDDYNDDNDGDIFYNVNPVQHNPVQHDPVQEISLQNAIAITFGKFLDKSLTVNYWKCGLDLNLNTWTRKLFSKKYYDEQQEKEQREKMKQYAINDCLALADLFFHMYPEKTNDHQTPPETPKTTTTIKITNDLSDISEDELIEILRPKFYPKPTSSNQSNSSDEQQPTQEHVQQPTTLSKAEKQRKKNEKYKWKKQNRPDFNRKIKRPIYYKYDCKKIRAQLRDDDIHTSHQITINEKFNEVMIGFKSQRELERARNIMKINYFSKSQYIDRWGK
jgi:hypothetical protein